MLIPQAIVGTDTVRVGAMAYRDSAVQAVNGNAALILDTQVYDTDGFWDPGANTRFTIPAGKAGIYLLQVSTFGSASGLSHVGFQKNGALVLGAGRDRPDAAAAYAAATSILALAEGEYVEATATTTVNINLGHATVVDAMTTVAIQRLSN